MSRSKRKTKIFPIAGSEKRSAMKKWKKSANGRLRRIPVEGDLPDKKINNLWASPSDGKHYWDKATEKDMRK